MLSLPVPADPELSTLLVAEAAALVGPGRVVEGLNASADSFYSSQVRGWAEMRRKSRWLVHMRAAIV